MDKIRKTENEGLLEEAYRLLEVDTEETETYKLNEGQMKAVAEAREQIKQGQFLTDDLANKEIDEWVNK